MKIKNIKVINKNKLTIAINKAILAVFELFIN